jgi:glycosyltransferase involved in cell wall biosynthesis
LALRALRDLPGVTMLMVGEGLERARLEALADRLGLTPRVRFTGAVAHAETVGIYNAADVLVLASTREGLPNVVLESLACSTPVVASAVWGTPEVLTAPEAGLLVQERTPEAFAAALRAVLAAPPPCERVRAFALRFGWEPTVAGLQAVFAAALGGAAAGRDGPVAKARTLSSAA